MIMYKTGGYKELIQEVEVERSTEHMVWVNGMQSSKISRYHRFFDNKDEAKEYLIKEFNGQIATAKSIIKSAELQLKKVNEY